MAFMGRATDRVSSVSYPKIIYTPTYLGVF